MFDENEISDNDLFEEEFNRHKANYYVQKLHYEEMNE